MFLSRVDLWPGDMAQLVLMPTPLDIARHVPDTDETPQSKDYQQTFKIESQEQFQEWLRGWEN